MKNKVFIRKFNGDDEYSYAVFIKNQNDPVIAGLSKREAQSHKLSLEKRRNEK